jgi:phosphatidylglycerophosphatase A
MKNFSKFKWFIITGFFSGLLPKAPGTWGSLVATILAYLIIIYFPNPYTTIWLLIILFSIIGYKFVNEYEQTGGIHDDKRIVIDEFAGVLISIGVLGNLKEDTLIKLILAFISFRFFDIYKPSIIGKIDKKAPGSLGVMGDDIIAGFFGGILAGILYIVYLKFKAVL